MAKTDDAVVKSDTNRDVTKWDVVTEEKLDKNMPSAVNDNSEHGAVTQLDDVTKYRTETKSNAATKFDSKGYYCNVCHFSFWTEGGLRQHSSSHNKASLFDQDRHKEELDAERKTVESKHEKPKEKIENGNEGTNGNEGMNGNEGKNHEAIVLESNGDEPKGDTEPNKTTEKNIQSNNAADKDNEISENSEENKIDPKDSDIEILEVIGEPKVNEVVKKLTEDAERKSSEVVDEVKTETESDNNKSKAKEREATKPVTEKDNEVTDDKEKKLTIMKMIMKMKPKRNQKTKRFVNQKLTKLLRN